MSFVGISFVEVIGKWIARYKILLLVTGVAIGGGISYKLYRYYDHQARDVIFTNKIIMANQYLKNHQYDEVLKTLDSLKHIQLTHHQHLLSTVYSYVLNLSNNHYNEQYTNDLLNTYYKSQPKEFDAFSIFGELILIFEGLEHLKNNNLDALGKIWIEKNAQGLPHILLRALHAMSKQENGKLHINAMMHLYQAIKYGHISPGAPLLNLLKNILLSNAIPS